MNQDQIAVEKVTGAIYRMLNQASSMVASLEDALNASGKQLEEMNKKIEELTLANKPEQVVVPAK